MKEEKKILLVHKFLTGEASSDEILFFNSWVKDSSENLKLVNDIKMILSISMNIKKDNVPINKEKVKDTLFSRINNDSEKLVDYSNRKEKK